MNDLIKKKILPILFQVVGFFIFLAAVWMLFHELKGNGYHDLLKTFRLISADKITTAVFFTVISFMLMSVLEWIALEALSVRLSFSKIALASFVSNALSQTVSLFMLSGNYMRFRYYSAWGVTPVEITNFIVIRTISFWIGLFAACGIVFVLSPATLPIFNILASGSLLPSGLVLLAIVAGYFFWLKFSKDQVTFRSWTFFLPPPANSFVQIILSATDWVVTGIVLYVLLPDTGTVSFSFFLSAYFLAQTIGLISHVPAGLGVFEFVMIKALSPVMPQASVFSALIAYRLIYYMLPLAISAVVLSAYEIFIRFKTFTTLVGTFGKWMINLAPAILTASTFFGGAVLLISGATPSVQWRLKWLKMLIPLPLVEASHFLGSVTGMLMLLLSWGLLYRLNGAYVMSLALTGIGIIVSLLKGFDYEEALTLFVIFTALLASRKHFRRQSSLFSGNLTASWVAAIGIVLSCTVWLLMFSYKHVDYSNELWWQFSFKSDASRSMRSAVGSLCVLLGFAVYRLSRPAVKKAAMPTQEDIETAFSIARSYDRTYANLVFLQDKYLLFNQTRNAFLMFGIKGRSWIAMGDPIGPKEEAEELLWEFRELCDLNNAQSVFYEISDDHLPFYVDMGLTLLKIGEEARIDLKAFSLEGGANKGLRHSYNRLLREQCSFEVLNAPQKESDVSGFSRISLEWLESKSVKEKGFSLGFFDEKYIGMFPVAVAKKDGETCAFANLWQGKAGTELSIDLMRYSSKAPQGVMDFLITGVMLWGKEQGYSWFNLGMAPLSGIEKRPLAPMWTKIGYFIFTHGEQFYNFQGLRQYKEKFNPVWQPKYIALVGGMALPQTLLNITSLISKGKKGVFKS